MAGERKGFEDDRGKLFYEIIRIVKEFGDKKPSVIVLENSPHLRNGEGGAWFLEVSKELKSLGYWFRESSSARLTHIFSNIDSFHHKTLVTLSYLGCCLEAQI